MLISELEQELRDSLDDLKLDQDEKRIFRDFSKTLDDDELRFIRNTAFKLAQPYVQQGGDPAIKALNWLSKVVKAIQVENKDTLSLSEVYFSPGNSCRDRIISLIKAAKNTVNICVFTISDNQISKEILSAHQRGVAVTVISDNDKANDRGSDVYHLLDQGVDVRFDNTDYHMHHKFAVFDNAILLTGSFNWTRSASQVNDENILITTQPELLTPYLNQFAKLKKQFS